MLQEIKIFLTLGNDINNTIIITSCVILNSFGPVNIKILKLFKSKQTINGKWVVKQQ